jgi:Ras-related protein Rab-24
MGSNTVDIKVVLIGAQFAGKTSIIHRFIHNRFLSDVPYEATIGAAYTSKSILVGPRYVTIGLWDTAGSERYESITRMYYRGAWAAIVCFDLTDHLSFQRAEFWINDLRKIEPTCRVYLCGTKKDLLLQSSAPPATAPELKPRAIALHVLTEFAARHHAELCETSAATGAGVGEMFERIAQDYVATSPAATPDSPGSSAPSSPFASGTVRLTSSNGDRRGSRPDSSGSEGSRGSGRCGGYC